MALMELPETVHVVPNARVHGYQYKGQRAKGKGQGSNTLANPHGGGMLNAVTYCQSLHMKEVSYG